MIRRAVPLALGLISVSNPQIPVMDTLSKLSHDHDADVAQGAIFALGLIGAGTFSLLTITFKTYLILIIIF